MTIDAFNSALASSSPTPGGGTASAIALGQAASLTCMVAELTLANEKWRDGWDISNRCLELATPMIPRSGELAQEDSDAFDQVMASFRLPKQDQDDLEKRKQAIQASTLNAALVPLETAQQSVSLLSQLTELARDGNKNAVTDVGVAALLASAAAKGALFNVQININSLKEVDTSLTDEVQQLSESAKQLSRQVMEEVRRHL